MLALLLNLIIGVPIGVFIGNKIADWFGL